MGQKNLQKEFNWPIGVEQMLLDIFTEKGPIERIVIKWEKGEIFKKNLIYLGKKPL
jgi:hypothetical protein